ncbi:MAG: response regulator [Proteobacteria bacterium]|nr:response regulator [Pseudomonadota bacterium]
MKTKQILVVDDDNVMRSAISMALRRAGYKVLTAKDGEQALRIVEDRNDVSLSVDLMLTDLDMPILSGLELIDRLAFNGIFTPTVVMSASEDEQIVSEILGSNCDGYLKKPFELREMLERVDYILGEQVTAQDAS